MSWTTEPHRRIPGTYRRLPALAWALPLTAAERDAVRRELTRHLSELSDSLLRMGCLSPDLSEEERHLWATEAIEGARSTLNALEALGHSDTDACERTVTDLDVIERIAAAVDNARFRAEDDGKELGEALTWVADRLELERVVDLGHPAEGTP